MPVTCSWPYPLLLTSIDRVVVHPRGIVPKSSDRGVMEMTGLVMRPVTGTSSTGVRLSSEVHIWIAGGEINRGIHELAIFLDKGCYGILQPNCTMAEGMFQVRKLAAMAEVKHKLCTPHAWVQGPGFYANLHVAGSISNCPWIEFPYDPPAITPENFHSIITEIPQIDGEGYVEIPDKPGLGVEINWDVVKKYSK